jgi:O-glycosyl hydrolase
MWLKQFFRGLSFSAFCLVSASSFTQTKVSTKQASINALATKQNIAGFGVNICPAQWNNGKLKSTLFKLKNDLGAEIFRVDCYGKANWLNPNKLNADGHFSKEHLAEVYQSKTFTDAWATCKYLNSLGIEPIFNISGEIPAAWTTNKISPKDPMVNFEAYAEMAVSLVHWAREKEGIKFSQFMPFNETDIGYPEGPRILADDMPKALDILYKKLAENGFVNLKLIVFDDAGINPDRIVKIAESTIDINKLEAIGVHTYGNGLDGDGRGGWLEDNSPFTNTFNALKNTSLAKKQLWLTEYGDLDQSGEIEYEVAWRSTRRLMKALNDGIHAGIAWDAYDNYHVHDSTYAYYGLLKTDTTHFTYTPKPRYFAAKQIYKFVRPGFKQVAFNPAPPKDPNYIYNEWIRSFRNMLFSAFVNETTTEMTVVGMSSVEKTTTLELDLQNFSPDFYKKGLYFYRTSPTENCVLVEKLLPKNGKISVKVTPKSIFTISSLR